MKATCRLALLAAMVVVTCARGDLASLLSLYSIANIAALLNDEKVKRELQITKQQEKAIQPLVAKSYQKLAQENVNLVRVSGSDKEARIRALHTARADELFVALGQWGIVLFDHREIRDALQLSDEQVARLKAMHEKIRNDIAKHVMAGRITREQAHKQATALSRGIPDAVRSTLTNDQRQSYKTCSGSLTILNNIGVVRTITGVSN
jgi:hypothetical protein